MKKLFAVVNKILENGSTSKDTKIKSWSIRVNNFFILVIYIISISGTDFNIVKKFLRN